MNFVVFGHLNESEKIYTYVACQDKTIKILSVYYIYECLLI